MTVRGRRRRILQFTSCKGVFQGGGCRAFAFVGAYKAAVDAGVVFTEVCGTSAGSIFASLIAAGASPGQMQDIVNRTDVDVLFHRPWYKKGWLQYLSILGKGYVIDPEKLENILNNELASLLGIEGIVKFHHLRIPLTVIASDLCRHTYKIFSSEKTRDFSVAHAVVCSSAFTTFFRVQDCRYTDGGLVSNMPAFAIKASNHFDKILAFNLLSEETDKIKDKNICDIIGNVITTVTSANVEIQSRLVPKCYVVPIDVKEYGTLEFEKIKDWNWLSKLIQRGEESAKAFFDKKQYPASDVTPHEDMLNKSVEMRTQISLISLNEEHDLKSIYVVAPNTIWARELFPLIVGWFNEGIHIEVYCKGSPVKSQDDEDARKRMLRYLGCELYEVQYDLPVIGYFVERRNDKWEAVISSENSEKGRYYHLAVDKPLLTATLQSIKANVPSTGVPYNLPGHTSISLLQVPDNIIISKIMTEPLYHGASISYERVKLSNVCFLTKYVLNYKYINIELMYQLYKDANLDPFCAATIVMGQKDSLVGPPVLEEHNGKLFVIEGNTRCFYSLRNREDEIVAIVVRNVSTPLPASGRYSFENMILTDNSLDFNSRYNNSNRAYFRHIERCLRPYQTYLL